jgi:hypothetical protein
MFDDQKPKNATSGKLGTARKRLCALRQAEAGQKVSEICGEMGVSQQAFGSGATLD